MPRAILCVAMVLALAYLPSSGAGQETNDNRQRHSWARFGIGSWKRVRVVTDTLDQTGSVETTTREDTKTTLVQVDKSRYTIKVETTVEVAGKRLEGRPRYITRGYHGEVNGQKARIEDLGFRDIMVCGQPYRSEVKRIVIDDEGTKLVSKVFCAADATPYVLRRETVGTAGTTSRFESLVEVTAMDRLSNVLGQLMLSSHIKTVNRSANGHSTETLEVHCTDIPGGVVSHTGQTVDENGRLVQRRRLELLGYESFAAQPISHRVFRQPPFRGRRRGLFAPHWQD